MNLFELAEKLPPCVCRLVARKKNGWAPKSCRDIARESGLSVGYVSELSGKKSWRGIPIDVATRFAAACGVDLASPGPTIEFLRRTKKVHLKNAGLAQRRMFIRIMKPVAEAA